MRKTATISTPWHGEIKDGLVVDFVIWRSSLTLDDAVDSFNKDECVDEADKAKFHQGTANLLTKLADIGVDEAETVYGDTSCSVDEQTSILERVGKVDILLRLCATYACGGNDQKDRGDTWEEFEEPSNSTWQKSSTALVSILEEPDTSKGEFEKQEKTETEGCDFDGSDSLEGICVTCCERCLYPDDSRDECNDASDTKRRWCRCMGRSDHRGMFAARESRRGLQRQ